MSGQPLEVPALSDNGKASGAITGVRSPAATVRTRLRRNRNAASTALVSDPPPKAEAKSGPDAASPRTRHRMEWQ